MTGRVNGSGRPAEGERAGDHKTPLLFVGRVLGIHAVVRGNRLGGGGKTDGTGKSKSNKEIQYYWSNKSKMIKGVAVSGRDPPCPPLTSTNSRTGQGARSQATGLSYQVRGGQPSIGRGRPLKVHCNKGARKLNVEKRRMGTMRGEEYMHRQGGGKGLGGLLGRGEQEGVILEAEGGGGVVEWWKRWIRRWGIRMGGGGVGGKGDLGRKCV